MRDQMLGEKCLYVRAVDSVDFGQPGDSLLLGQRLCMASRLAWMLFKHPEAELPSDFGLAHPFDDLYSRIAKDEHASGSWHAEVVESHARDQSARPLTARQDCVSTGASSSGSK